MALIDKTVELNREIHAIELALAETRAQLERDKEAVEAAAAATWSVTDDPLYGAAAAKVKADLARIEKLEHGLTGTIKDRDDAIQARRRRQ